MDGNGEPIPGCQRPFARPGFLTPLIVSPGVIGTTSDAVARMVIWSNLRKFLGFASGQENSPYSDPDSSHLLYSVSNRSISDFGNRTGSDLPDIVIFNWDSYQSRTARPIALIGLTRDEPFS